MKRGLIVLALLLAGYFCTGFYTVGSNEQAVVRRFGRVLLAPHGGVRLQGSGLHYDLPWPFTQISRINLNQLHTISIGQAETDDLESNAFIQPVNSIWRSQFLTGDKNILHMKIDVNYRISGRHAYDYLFGSESPERQLQLLAESVLSDLVSRSGVDFVHTLGRAELQERLTHEIRRLAESPEHRMGLEVENVTIDSVYPPIRVKADFLDVSNARADKQTYINQAQAEAGEKLESARADARKILDQAEIYRQQLVEAARGEADSFTKLVQRFQRDEQEGLQTTAAARNLTLQRLYLETMENILRNVAGKVFLDSGKPVDLTIFRDPNE